MCEGLQISHTFFDAPGAEAAIFLEGREADLAPEAKPYVTMVFCGPADYKVNRKRKLMPKSGSTDAFLHLSLCSIIVSLICFLQPAYLMVFVLSLQMPCSNDRAAMYSTIVSC